MDLALAPYKVLDLTDEKGLLCGKLLGDLGAYVIKVEMPGGDPARNIGPFYHNIHHPEKSLYWFAYNTNKRSITLDITKPDGQEIFKELVKSADFVIESFSPGYMDSLGLGYRELSQINPRVIMTSISPFGQTGPYAHHRASDLTVWAMGGYLYICGEPDRPPVCASFAQAYLNAAADAAAATMIAHWYRELSGEGQQVDVSIQEAVIDRMLPVTVYWSEESFVVHRVGGRFVTPHLSRKIIYRCQDGNVALILQGGSTPAQVRTAKGFVKWMDEEGMAPDWLKEFDWVNDYDTMVVTQELVDQVENIFSEFIATKIKKQIYEESIKRDILITPINTIADLSEFKQLIIRDFWENVEHPDLNDTLTYCGPFVKLSETPCIIRRRAPLIGEDNEQIYIKELGFSYSQFNMLRQANII